MSEGSSQVRAVGEFFELDAGADLEQSPRYNEDIAPTKVSERTWNRWNVASLWVGMAICVPTYTLGGVLTAYFGLSVTEALWTIFGIESRSGFNFHNTYLSSAVEIGLTGTLLQVILIGAALIFSGRLVAATGAPGHALLFALAAMLTAVTMFEAPVFYQFNLQSVIFLLILGYSAPRLSDREER